MLEDLIVAATNQAIEKVKAVAAEEMGQATDALNLPGLSDALSRFGLELDGAAERGRELVRDREPEPRARIIA